MRRQTTAISAVLIAVAAIAAQARATVREVHTFDELAAAIEQSEPGDEIILAPGEYRFPRTLHLASGITLRGAGVGKTIAVADPAWQVSTDTLPREDDPSAYLFSMEKVRRIKISGMTLRGPNVHGAVFANAVEDLELFDLHVKGFLWSGIRTWRMKNYRVHDCTFVDAGGKFGSTTGGALFMHWSADSEFWNNRMTRTEGAAPFYGIKGYGGKNCRLHHNTINVNFAIEFPHDNNAYMEIDHNVLHGCVSIPKHAGGSVPEGGYTFHIHHNWFTTSYALEWPRNAVEVDYNVFTFSPEADGGNLISRFGNESAPGPTDFHDNLILNPGRGLFWTNGVYDHFRFANNHVIAHRTATPRTEGLFGFHRDTDFSTIVIADNIIECRELPRPLVRNEESYAAVVENNTLIGITDADRFENRDTGAPRGPRKPLEFSCGVDGEYHVRGFEVTRRSETPNR
ncbi:MAG: hypothetical protein D6741_19080 [Planctomycetota bacterium]|nr:MAG: hypothetical protein D6741_19080 [Planctomycetota bacterium]